MHDLDTFVERVLLHNNVVTAEQVAEAKQIAQEYEGSNLIEGLISAGALDADKARAIWNDYRKWSVKQAQQKAAARPPAPPAPAPTSSGIPTAPRADQDAVGGFFGGAGEPGRAGSPMAGSSAPSASGAGLDVEMLQRLAAGKKKHERRSTAIYVNPNSDRGRDLNNYLRMAREAGASDLHIKPNIPPMIRRNKQLVQAGQPFTEEQSTAILHSILSEEQRETLQEQQALEFSYTVDGLGRHRAIIIKQREGYEGTFRILQSEVRKFTELGLPDVLARLTEYTQGMVLVTGPTGAGKSTTLASLVQLVNEQRQEHIITIEDPVEYVFDPVNCQITQRQVGLHTRSFSKALRASLREDPDVIMIGELRDLETISLAITAADTGHLVFGTTDTTSAPRTIDRILNVFPPDEQDQIRKMIADSIKGIICQQLLPRKDGSGMVLALEILINTPASANMIRDAKLHQMHQLMQTQKQAGMVVMDNYLLALVQHELIDGTEAYYAAHDKTAFEQWAPVIV